MNALGAISFDENDQLSAHEYYEQAFVIGQEQGTKPIEGRALRGLGDVYRVQHRYAEAARYYQRAITIAIELDTLAEHCAVLRRQGLLAHDQKHYLQALESWVHALVLDHRLGHPARKYLQDTVDALVREQKLEDAYEEFCKKYGLD
jgi:tetratricopeptide (TPR) repeat protein